MCDDSDQETSELDIQSRTWRKLENTLKLEGFREGAAEGRHLALQEGFNLGFLDGFKLGECIGMYKGIIRCESEISHKQYDLDEETLDKMSNEACVLCTQEQKSNTSHSNLNKTGNIEDIISAQQTLNNEVLKILEKSDLQVSDKR